MSAKALLEEYNGKKYSAAVYKYRNGSYAAISSDCIGARGGGTTAEAALAELQEDMSWHVQYSLEQGDVHSSWRVASTKEKMLDALSNIWAKDKVANNNSLSLVRVDEVTLTFKDEIGIIDWHPISKATDWES